jgi:cyclase
MLKKRLIPSLLLKDGRCIKTVRFDVERDTGAPVTAAKVYDAQGADELVFLDITATSQARDPLFDIVMRTAEGCFMPLAVGGGVRTVEDVRRLLHAGADKVIINTEAVRRPEFIREVAEKFGNQCVVVGIDVRWRGGRYEVFTHRGTVSSGLEPVAWARQAVEYGAGEIFLSSIDRDGTMMGYDLELVRLVADAVTVPVIASGGVGTLQDLVDGIVNGHASAVAAASIFHFTDQNLIKARTFMRQGGLDVRVG